MRNRIRCVLLTTDDWTTAMIAKSQLIDETTVCSHLHDWLNDEKLKPENGDSDSHLSEAQATELISHQTDNLLPTTHAIIAFIDEWWGISYTIPSMNKWLHRNLFSYKKLTGVPHKYSAEAQQVFVDTYNQLKSEASDDSIRFIDAVHPTLGTKPIYGWMPKGRKTIMETTGSQTRWNIMGALNLNDIGSTVIKEYDTINSLNISKLFIAIHEIYPITSKVHIILIGAGYHQSELVQEWASVMNIELHYLPPYCPKFNPIDRLSKAMNEVVRNNIIDGLSRRNAYLLQRKITSACWDVVVSNQ